MAAVVDGQSLTAGSDGDHNAAKPHWISPDGDPHWHPQPPPPPPPPAKPSLMRKARKAAGSVTDSVAAQPARYKLIASVVVLGVVNIAVTRAALPDKVNEEDVANRAAELAIGDVRAELDAAKNSSTQIAVPTPFSWAKCQLSTDAKVMIGGDPTTGGKTINPTRAALLEQQATALLSQFRMVDLRLTAPAVDQLRVVADNPTAGVALFNCTPDTSEPAPSPVVSAVPNDPTPVPTTAVQQ